MRLLLQLKQRNIKDAVKAYHRNSEKERTKELQRKERTRLQRLMQEDEEGYKWDSFIYFFSLSFFE